MSRLFLGMLRRVHIPVLSIASRIRGHGIRQLARHTSSLRLLGLIDHVVCVFKSGRCGQIFDSPFQASRDYRDEEEMCHIS
jgi:hypothetical protein